MVPVVPTLLGALLVLAAAPIWRWSKGWGWAPAGMLTMGVTMMVVFSLTVIPE